MAFWLRYARELSLRTSCRPLNHFLLSNGRSLLPVSGSKSAIRMCCKLKDNENSIYFITVRVKNGWSKLRVTGEWWGWREEMKYVSVLLWYQQLSTSGFVQKAELMSDNASCSASSLHCLTFFLLTTFPAIYAVLGAWTAEIPGSCSAAKCLINTVEVIGHTTHTHREPAPLLPALLVNDAHLREADVVGGILLFGLR